MRFHDVNGFDPDYNNSFLISKQVGIGVSKNVFDTPSIVSTTIFLAIFPG